MSPPAPSDPSAPSGEELERVRGALARGAGFAVALEDGARAGAGAEGIADLNHVTIPYYIIFLLFQHIHYFLYLF